MIEYERKILFSGPLYAVGHFTVEPVVDYFPPGDGCDFGVRYRVQGEAVYRALAGEAVASELTIKASFATDARREQTHAIPPMALSSMPATLKVRATLVGMPKLKVGNVVLTFKPGINVTIDVVASAKVPHVLELEALFDEAVDPVVAARIDAIAEALVRHGGGRWCLPSEQMPAPRYSQLARIMLETTDYEAPLRVSVEQMRGLLRG
jgi:hypothetical protein